MVCPNPPHPVEAPALPKQDTSVSSVLCHYNTYNIVCQKKAKLTSVMAVDQIPPCAKLQV